MQTSTSEPTLLVDPVMLADEDDSDYEYEYHDTESEVCPPLFDIYIYIYIYSLDIYT